MADDELITEVARLARSEREITSALIAHLAEFDQRRLYRGAGCPSLFAYCTEVLCLSEHEAYNRIEAARVVRRFPRVLDMLADGKLNLTTVRLLSPNLTEENCAHLLAEAADRGKRDVERLLARHFPKPAVPESIRKVPVRSGPATVSDTVDAVPVMSGPVPEAAAPTQTADNLIKAVETGWYANAGEGVAGSPPQAAPPPPASLGSRPGVLRPLNSEEYEVRFTAGAETCEKLRLAKDLLRHSVPNGNTAEVIDRALTALLADLARKKYAATARPRSGVDAQPTGAGGARSRHIPAHVKRTVWMRDVGRCAFVQRAAGGVGSAAS